MSKVFSLLAILVVSLIGPIFMLGGLALSAGSGASGGSSSELAQQMGAAGLENGRLPEELLMEVSRHGSYRCLVTTFGGAAQAWLSLVDAAQSQGVDLEGGWCYRTYEEQVALWTSRQCYVPGMCDGDPYPPTAEPGTSNHGWGLAVDVWDRSDLILGCTAPEFEWLQTFGPSFGWVHPEWAHCGRSGQEPWHWEFQGVPGLPGAGPVEENDEIGGSDGE